MGPKVDVEIVRFAGTREASITELMVVLGVERAEAVAIVESGGGTIKRAIPRAVAETYRDGLARAGVVVELRDVLVPPRRSERPKSPTARPPETGMTDVLRGGPASVPPGTRSSAIASDTPPELAPVEIPRAAAVPSFGHPRVPPRPRRADRSAPEVALDIATAEVDITLDAESAPRAAEPARPSARPSAPPVVPGALDGSPFHVVSQRPPPPRAHAAAAPPREEPDAPPTFWASIVPALSFPLRGPGIKWMVWIAVYAIFLELVATLARWAGPVGFAFVVLYGGGLMALTTAYYRACLWGRSVGASSPNDMPEMDADTIRTEFLLPGLWAASFVLISQAALWAWLVLETQRGVPAESLATSAVTWALALAPVAYWPMGIGRIALTGKFAAIWDVPGGLRAIFGAPVEYAVLVIIALATYLLPWLVFFLWLVPLGPVAMLIGAPFFFGVPLAYSHGVQGTLMAHVFAKAAPALDD